MDTFEKIAYAIWQDHFQRFGDVATFKRRPRTRCLRREGEFFFFKPPFAIKIGAKFTCQGLHYQIIDVAYPADSTGLAGPVVQVRARVVVGN